MVRSHGSPRTGSQRSVHPDFSFLTLTYLSFFQLVDDSKRTIVNYERHTFTRQKPTLEIGSEVLPYLDLVLVGFVTMSNDIKKREDAASAGS